MHSFWLPPGNLDVLAVTGPDAVKLLQGQLTCDVEAVSDPGCARGALCNNKGRVLATFILIRQGPTFFLVLNKGLGDIAAAVLKKYSPFYKCELRQLAGADHSCFGMVGDPSVIAPAVASLPNQSGQCANLEQGWICNLDQAQQQYLVYANAPSQINVPAGSVTDWLVSGMLAGQFPFLPADAEKYTPQDLHLDRNDYVSFTKGCYTGQEIVARMHYRGKLKKLMFLLEATWAPGTEPEQQTEILDMTGQPLGTTLKVLQRGDRLFALAILSTEVENGGTAHVKNRAGLQFDLRVF